MVSHMDTRNVRRSTEEDEVVAEEISNVVSKVLNFGEVTAKNFGSPINSVAMHAEKGSDFALPSIFCYLKIV